MPRHPDWIVPQWPAPTRIAALFTTRAGGVSTAPYDSLNLGLHVGDRTQAVLRNRYILRNALPADPVWLQQVHGTHVACLDDGAPQREADAAVTRRPHTVCAVMVADCMPVLLCDRDASVVACAHAGWRGLSAGVVEATLAAMDCRADCTLAWLGPAIGPQAFEVGADVRDSFLSRHPDDAACFHDKASGSRGEPKWWADLPELARRRLHRAGVRSVYGGRECTVSDRTRFFSHRRDGHCGRHAALIWMQGS